MLKVKLGLSVAEKAGRARRPAFLDTLASDNLNTTLSAYLVPLPRPLPEPVRRRQPLVPEVLLQLPALVAFSMAVPT